MTAKRSGTSRGMNSHTMERGARSGSREVVLSNDGTAEQGVMHTCSLSNREAEAALFIIQDFKLDYMAHLRPAWNTQDLISKNDNSNKAKLKQNKTKFRR